MQAINFRSLVRTKCRAQYQLVLQSIAIAFACLATIATIENCAGQNDVDPLHKNVPSASRKPSCTCAQCLLHQPSMCNRRNIIGRRPANLGWLNLEYLHWWPNAGRDLPLVTSSSAGTAAATAGILGLPSTTELLNNRSLTDGGLNGGRVNGGFWADDNHCQAWEGSYFGLLSESNFSVASGSIPIIARPYTDGLLGNSPAAFLVAHPAFLSGNLSVDNELKFQGAEFGIRSRLHELACNRLDFLLGYRYLNLDDNLKISSSSRYTAAQGAILAGTTKDVLDQFQAKNYFHGAQFGLIYREHMRWFDIDLQSRLSVGGTRSESEINGRTTNTVPGGGNANFQGGLYAQGTNIGRVQWSNVSVVPELRVGASRRLSPCLRASVNYNLMAWNHVARAANLIDTTLSQLPPQSALGQGRPLLNGARSTLLIQGINVGLQFEF